MSEHRWLVAAMYKFVTLPDPASLREPLLDLCRENGIFGTLLLAGEGINGTIAGPQDGIETVLTWLRESEAFSGIDVKTSWADEPPFNRMKVRIKREIVTLGAGDLQPAENAGTHVEAKDWNALISQPDMVIIDTRNSYETKIGTFEGAIDPHTESFGDFPQWADANLPSSPDTPIAMFCTGGIRCEKSTALLKARGYRNVFHLKGGILKYLEEVPEDESLWRGECFVFDQRVSVGHGLEVGEYSLCHACRMPITPEQMAMPSYVEGVSCPLCHDKQTPEQRERFVERQRQVEFARKRGETHIAADIGKAKAQKREEKRIQRERSG